MFQSASLPADLQPYQIFLQESGHNDRIYQALRNDDPADAAIILMDILDNSVDFTFKSEPKSEAKSNEFRNEGNVAYKKRCSFRKALECYNKALLYAPENSQAMRLAYSNRSAIFFTIQQYGASINDIEAVFAMGCTDHKLIEKLRQRKNECLKHVWRENLLLQSYYGTLPAKFFKFEEKPHPAIKCASAADIGVEMEDGMPKIVAARDLPVGKVVAIETPFVSGLNESDKFNVACYYCHKLTLNLIPCDGCCEAMFCDDNCRRKCNTEYHDIECKIMSCLQMSYLKPCSNLTVKALLKMKHLCKSWAELIQASYNMGEDRMRNSTLSASFDGKYKFSLLSFRDPKKHFIYGERYTATFSCAVVLLHLSKIPNYLPKEKLGKLEALRAMARIMINLFMSYPKVDILNGAKDAIGEYVSRNTEFNFGWFALAGKLNHCCDANLIALGLKNKIALVTICPVKKGEELTLSHIGHYFQGIMDNRALNLFHASQKICNCPVCTENWNPTNLKEVQLTAEENKAYEFWISVMRSNIQVKRDDVIFKVTCDGLATLNRVRGSKPHHDLIQEFRSLMGLCQFLATNNMFIHRDDEELEVIFPS